MEPNIIGELVKELGPWGAILAFVIYQLVRDRRNNNKAANPGSLDVIIGGMNEKLGSIQKAIEDLDENSEARHIRIRKSIDEQTAVVAESTGLVKIVHDKVSKFIKM